MNPFKTAFGRLRSALTSGAPKNRDAHPNGIAPTVEQTAPPEATRTQTSSERLAKQLRLAVAMRGGVSLAVWMGGACRELVRLRRGSLDMTPVTGSATPPADGADAGTQIYGKLLKLCGYTDGVEIDVIAGTSAGGLNGVLLGWHLARGASFDDEVRNMWLRLADLGDLSRRPLGDGKASLLRGDTYFYPQLLAALKALDGSGHRANRASTPLRLLVTATRLQPRRDAVFPGAGPRLDATESRSFFRFRYPGRFGELQPLDDFRDATRLAYVARTTSSFPGAFEPATVNPCAPDPVDPQTAPVNVHGISAESRAAATSDADTALEMIDGGVLDNIPLTWAVRAVAGMPSITRVDRWLLYLQPDPGEQTTLDIHARPTATRMLKSLIQTSRLKNSSESILDDDENLRQLKASEMREHAILRGISCRTVSKPDAIDSGRQLCAYRRAVGRAELARLRRLATAPLSIVGVDPLPLPDVQAPLVAAAGVFDNAPAAGPLSDYDPGAPNDSVNPAELAVPTGVTAVEVGSTARTPLVAARTVTLLLHALRDAESLGMQNIDPNVLAEVRKEVYALRFACEVVTAYRDRLLLQLIASNRECRPRTLLATSTMELRLPPTPTASCDPDGSFWRLWARNVADNAAIPSVMAPTDTWADKPFASLWTGVVSKAVKVARVLRGIECPDSPLVQLLQKTKPEKAPFPQMNRLLCRLEITTGPHRPDPLGSSCAPRLVVASAAERSPLEKDIYGAWLDPADRIQHKLNGNQIGNFAAFLSARWRQNDWFWGRMDGAQSLVRLIATPERVKDLTANDLEDLFFTGAPIGGSYRDLLQKQWQNGYYAHAPAEKVVEAITARLHWDIINHELPHLQVLQARKAKDRPPSRREEKTPAPSMFANGTEPPLHLIADVGNEQIRDLLQRPDLRRAQLQLALVALRAALPGGLKGTLAYAASSFTTGPLALLPFLLAVLAPWGMLTSMLSLGALTAVFTRHYMSLAQIPSLAGLLLIVLCSTTKFWRWKYARLSVLAVGVATIVVLLKVGREWALLWNPPWWLIAILALLAVTAPMTAVMLSSISHLWRSKEFSKQRSTASACAMVLIVLILSLSAHSSWPFNPGEDGVYSAGITLIMVYVLLVLGFWGLVLALSAPLHDRTSR